VNCVPNRSDVRAKNVVATSQPLAAQAGLQAIKAGGNAIDAAIAAAATLVVVEPTGNGLGSDAFAIVHHKGELLGWNGSGKSPRAWQYDSYSKYEQMPINGWEAVTIPGAVRLWKDLSTHYGKLDFQDLLKTAISYAENGFLVSDKISQAWSESHKRFSEYHEISRVFFPNGRAPRPGELFRNPDLANSLKDISSTNTDSFYSGELARKIVSHAKSDGAYIDASDLSDHSSLQVKPLGIKFRDVELFELPPNGQGIAALIAMGILEQIEDFPKLNSLQSIHLQIEAMKLGFSAVDQYLADPEYMNIEINSLLESSVLKKHARRISYEKCQDISYDIPVGKGTVYLSTADEQGNMVSFIQSNYMGFGSGIVIPETGISMQNRGCGFSLKKGHPNQVDGGKRPRHTILPAFAKKEGKPFLSFGVMGGRMQPQGHVQVLLRIVEYKQSPQEALDAPRWCVLEDGRVALEGGFSNAHVEGLTALGHKLVLDQPTSLFGGGQVVMKHGDGYVAGSDSRKDGCALGC